MMNEISALQLQLRTPTLNPVQTTPVQDSFAERRAANWNVRGTWRDSFWLDFEDGWVFPHGTNHLPGVEAHSQGQVRATPFDNGDVVVTTNGVAAGDFRALWRAVCRAPGNVI